MYININSMFNFLKLSIQFTKPEVIESYNKFTGNFMNAKLTVQQLRIQHMSFARFLEVPSCIGCVHLSKIRF